MADFDEINVGDTVLRVTPYGWRKHRLSLHVVARKTKTRITIDIGDQFTNHLRLVGDDPYRITYIEKYDPARHDELLQRNRAMIEIDQTARRLSETKWAELPLETLQRIEGLLRNGPNNDDIKKRRMEGAKAFIRWIDERDWTIAMPDPSESGYFVPVGLTMDGYYQEWAKDMFLIRDDERAE